MPSLFRAPKTADFDRIYQQHAASVYRYAFAVLGNHADAEDVTQQTFLKAYRAMATGTKPRKAENWLLTIVHNEVRRHLRSAQARALEVELDEQVAQPTPERSEPSVADVVRALQHLPPAQRSALVMREFEGRSYAEIAETLDVTQSALETLLFRARRGLAEQLEDGLTCAEAEQALSRRLDRRLPRRESRRLKAHLRECPLCARFADTQKRQRSLLEGLSVIPIPASLFVFRGEQASAAGLGTGAVAAGGTAAVGAGGTGIAIGLVAKAAAVTAAVGVAGGASYGVAAQTGFVVAKSERKTAHAAAVAETRNGARADQVRLARARGARPGPAAPALVRPARKSVKVKTPGAGPPAHANALAKTKSRGLARGHNVQASKERPAAVAPTKVVAPRTVATKRASQPKARTRLQVGKRKGQARPEQPKVRRPAPAAAKPKAKPPPDADPNVPPGVAQGGTKKSPASAP